MKLIKTFITGLRNSYHVAVNDSILLLIDQYGAESLGLTSQFITDYQTKVSSFKDAVNRPLASGVTVEVRNADKERDALFRYVRNVLTNIKFSPDAEVAALYPTIDAEILKIYPSSVRYEADHEEYAHIEGFIIDVNRTLSRHISKLGLADALTKLSNANKRFLEAFNSRNSEKQYRLDASALRTKVQQCYEYVVTTVNFYAMQSASTEEAVKEKCQTCQNFIVDVNNVISEYTLRQKQSQGGKKEDAGSGSGTGTAPNGGPMADNNSGDGQVKDELDNGTPIPGSGTSIKS
ncbi:MAG: hypothetical protein KBT20_06425 [Bacteroidales bacterium]|nr:hypothetical protein [Candidatus Liminaster caballi]